jgi:hypothetical protein
MQFGVSEVVARWTRIHACQEATMSGIGSIGSSTAVSLRPAGSGNSGGTSLTLSADEKSAASADAAATQASARLAAAQQAKAAASAIQTDQLAVKTTSAAAQTADAKVQTDENASGSLNIAV